MKYNPDMHHRRSIRLKHYDYSQSSAYFVTICTQNKTCFFGDVVDGEMRLSDAGDMTLQVWNELPFYYPNVTLDEFVVMPNHVHGILNISNVGAQFIAPAVDNMFVSRNGVMNQNQSVINHAPTVGKIVRTFKARCTYMINEFRNTRGALLSSLFTRVLMND